MDIAFLFVRLVVGAAIAAHGTQKLFGWFGGYGLAGTGGFFEQLGFRPGTLFAGLASLGEIAGGLLTVFGLFGALGPAIIIMVMLVAAIAAHLPKGFWASNGGYELALMYATASVAIAFAGNGTYSLDRLLGLTLFTSTAQVGVQIAGAVVLALLNVAMRRAPATATQ